MTPMIGAFKGGGVGVYHTPLSAVIKLVTKVETGEPQISACKSAHGRQGSLIKLIRVRS